MQISYYKVHRHEVCHLKIEKEKEKLLEFLSIHFNHQNPFNIEFILIPNRIESNRKSFISITVIQMSTLYKDKYRQSDNSKQSRYSRPNEREGRIKRKFLLNFKSNK